MHGLLQLSRNTFCNTKRNSLFTNTLDRLDKLILLYPVQADILTLLQPVLSLGVDRLRGVGFHLAGVQAQVVERESLHHGAEIIGLTQSLSAGGAKVAHVMTDLTRVHIRQEEPTNLFREGISGKTLTNQIKYVTNLKVQEVAHMVMHAKSSMSDSPKRPLQLQRPVLRLLLVNSPLI